MRRQAIIALAILVCTITAFLSLSNLNKAVLFSYNKTINITTNTSALPENISIEITLPYPNINETVPINLTANYSREELKGPSYVLLNGTNKTINLTLELNTSFLPGRYTYFATFQNNSFSINQSNTTGNLTNTTNNSSVVENDYLYNVKINLEVLNASYYIDADNDGFVEASDCNDSNPMQNPNMTEIYYNGIDDDCNNETPDNHAFTISLNKNSYNLGELISVNVYAPPQANISLEFCSQPDNSGWSSCYYPIEYVQRNENEIINVYYANKTGNFEVTAIMQYFNKTIHAISQYNVVNTINIEVSGERTIKQNESTTLTATASGGIGQYSYKWIKHDNSSVNARSITLANLTPGTYQEKIIVTDSEGNNKSKVVEVVVKPIYTIKIKVLDSADNKSIGNATISFDFGLEVVTNNQGIATVKLAEGSYHIMISHKNYESTTKDFEADKDKTIEVFLDVKDTYAPRIELLEPANNNETNDKEVTFKFKVEDESKMSCVLYLSDGNTLWFKEKYNISNIDSGTYETTLNLDPKVYLWQVECIDMYGNKAESEVWSLEVLEETKAIEYISQEIYDKIDEAISNIDRLDMESKKAADLLKLKNKLSKVSIKLREINRDLNDINLRHDLSDAEKEEKKKELLKRKDDLIQETIKSISVKESKTFVKYVSEEQLKEVASKYEEKISNRRSKTRLEELLKYLQNKVYVETSYYVGEVETLGGEKFEITLIRKRFKVNGSGVKNTRILEYLPKEIVNDAKEIEVVASPEGFSIIDPDPLISFPIGESEGEIVYYIKKRLSESEVKNLASLYFGDTTVPKKKNSITGFASFDVSNVRVDWKSGALLLVVLAILAYLFLDGALLSLPIFKNKKIKYIKVLIYDALDNLDAGDLKKANLLYKEIKMIYEDLPEYGKAKVYEKIKILYDRINERALKEALENLEKDKLDVEEAKKWAELAVAAYSKLSNEVKKEHYDKLKAVLGKYNFENET